ncbi:hypothetical protein NQ317_001687 [Molorchus minor]|uniref:Uncharacterized protein n=1 Tax=Molorchus minor TaxID=1323400 RepID=A0ABQ9JHV1_9CUCU|nr:hypothetical protein NQ317_001687 [Molorchus minor]
MSKLVVFTFVLLIACVFADGDQGVHGSQGHGHGGQGGAHGGQPGGAHGGQGGHVHGGQGGQHGTVDPEFSVGQDAHGPHGSHH